MRAVEAVPYLFASLRILLLILHLLEEGIAPALDALFLHI
jgi:hypothetical protein